MPKFFCILILGFTLCLPSFATSSNQFGLLGGVNLSNISATPDESYSGNMGGLFGGFWEHSLFENFGFSLEFYFLQKGGKRGTDDVNVHLSYLEVPLLARFHAGTRRFGVVFFGGPAASYLTNASGEQADGTTSDVTGIHRSELSLHGGASLEIPINNEISLTAGARYVQGLTNFSKGTNSLTNQGIVITAGVVFTDPQRENSKDLNRRAEEFLERKYPDSAPPLPQTAPADSSETPEPLLETPEEVQ